MSTPTFYHPELEVNDTLVKLSKSESSHAIKSRRLKLGKQVNVINGKGLLANGVISEVVRKQLLVSINSVKQFLIPSKYLTIATAIPKGDRQKTMVDMLVQLGVQQIIPLQCDYSSSVFKQNSLEKWQRVSIEACKQSQNPWLPKISEALTVSQLIKLYSNDTVAQLVYADGEGDKISEIELLCEHLVIMIGPEGGFSENEKDQFYSEKLAPIRLAEAILRSETAAITSAAQYFSHRS